MRWSLINALVYTLTYGQDQNKITRAHVVKRVASQDKNKENLKDRHSQKTLVKGDLEDLARPLKEIFIEHERVRVPAGVTRSKHEKSKKILDEKYKSISSEQERLSRHIKDFERKRETQLKDIAKQQAALEAGLESFRSQQESVRKSSEGSLSDLRASRDSLNKREEDFSRQVSDFMGKRLQAERDLAAERNRVDELQRLFAQREQELNEKLKRREESLSEVTRNHEQQVSDFNIQKAQLLSELRFKQRELDSELERMKRQQLNSETMSQAELSLCQKSLQEKQDVIGKGIEEMINVRSVLNEKDSEIMKQKLEIQRLENIIAQKQTTTQTVVQPCMTIIECKKLRGIRRLH